MSKFVFILFVLGMLMIIGYSISHAYDQRQKAIVQLRKLVTQAGYRVIEISTINQYGTQGVMHFVVKFKDANDSYRVRNVKRDLNTWGSLTGDFYWDKPLKVADTLMMTSRLDSKEQIISDMDAEIKRLRKELDEAKKGD